jgi:hypothetical protein
MTKGNCEHEVWAGREVWQGGKIITQRTVALSNSMDPHYVTYFETPAEVDAFIAQLEQAKKEAFGPLIQPTVCQHVFFNLAQIANGKLTPPNTCIHCGVISDDR